jgi:hypothetical protein
MAVIANPIIIATQQTAYALGSYRALADIIAKIHNKCVIHHIA